MSTFKQAVHSEISDALKAHAVVLIVSPPVVQALATYYHSEAETWIQAEFQVADSFHNRNVHNINLNAQMDSYLTAHGETYLAYRGDNWHPNEAGHLLAGQLLYNNVLVTFGMNPILYK